jgi:hypothetical protein
MLIEQEKMMMNSNVVSMNDLEPMLDLSMMEV